MRLLRLVVMSLASLLSFAEIAVTTQTMSRKLALTFDDLPYAATAGQPFLSNAQRATKQMLGVLKQNRAPAIGFVNEVNLRGEDSTARIGPTWLWRWMRSLGLNLSFKDDPEPPRWVIDLYNQH